MSSTCRAPATCATRAARRFWRSGARSKRLPRKAVGESAAGERIAAASRPKQRTSGVPTVLRPATRRHRAHRVRARDGKIVLWVEVDHARLIEAIVRHGALTEAERYRAPR